MTALHHVDHLLHERHAADARRDCIVRQAASHLLRREVESILEALHVLEENVLVDAAGHRIMGQDFHDALLRENPVA